MSIAIPDLTRDQLEYLEGIAKQKWDPQKPCEDCGAPMGEHRVGGPGPSHPWPLKPATYDPACYDLAEKFLSDTPAPMQTQAHKLAGHIQRAIEDWCEYEERAYQQKAGAEKP